jgi:hypothetical protein
VKYDIYEYISPLDIEVIVHQNPCENEGYVTKLKESENKRELSDSTYLNLESTCTVSMRDTPLKNKDLEHKSCEYIFETKNLLSTSSVFFPNV